mgnify:CR=1 FL=1
MSEAKESNRRLWGSPVPATRRAFHQHPHSPGRPVVHQSGRRRASTRAVDGLPISIRESAEEPFADAEPWWEACLDNFGAFRRHNGVLFSALRDYSGA